MQPITHDAKLRRLVRNMVYDGVLSKLLAIDTGQMEKALRKQMGKKVKGDRAEHVGAQGRLRLRRSQPAEAGSVRRRADGQDAGMILIEGNAAAAIGCMMAGVTFVGWYPITPSSSLCESLIDYLKKYRKDPETGKATYAVIQAEDELAALGMVLGAGWVGARSMTSSAGPGISLMSEFTGLGYYAEIPAVIFDVQRVRARPPASRPAPASRTSCRPPSCRTATPSTRCCYPARSPSATRWRWTPSTSPSRCRRRSS